MGCGGTSAQQTSGGDEHTTGADTGEDGASLVCLRQGGWDGAALRLYARTALATMIPAAAGHQKKLRWMRRVEHSVWPHAQAIKCRDLVGWRDGHQSHVKRR